MYSEIISASDYTQIMSEHVYMKAADYLVADTALKHGPSLSSRPKILDIGCGPGRITRLIAENKEVDVEGVDIDTNYLQHAATILPQIKFTRADLLTYQHPSLVQVIVSHGLDHHISGEYLKRVSDNLTEDGVYILGDEFLPYYSTERERQLNAIIWYAHVITAAKKSSHDKLATEEAKTLLDDIFALSPEKQKTVQLIQLVEDHVLDIDKTCKVKDWAQAQTKAANLLELILSTKYVSTETNPQIITSRGDYKICLSELAAKLKLHNLYLANIETVGPVNTIGGFAVCVIKKIN